MQLLQLPFSAAEPRLRDARRNAGNIFTGQFHRLRRVITDPDNFAFEMARIVQTLHGSGYSQRNLLRTYGRLLQFMQHAFDYARRAPVYCDLLMRPRTYIQDPATFQPS